MVKRKRFFGVEALECRRRWVLSDAGCAEEVMRMRCVFEMLLYFLPSNQQGRGSKHKKKAITQARILSNKIRKGHKWKTKQGSINNLK